jgi:hypothetical protein
MGFRVRARVQVIFVFDLPINCSASSCSVMSPSAKNVLGEQVLGSSLLECSGSLRRLVSGGGDGVAVVRMFGLGGGRGCVCIFPG